MIFLLIGSAILFFMAIWLLNNQRRTTDFRKKIKGLTFSKTGNKNLIVLHI